MSSYGANLELIPIKLQAKTEDELIVLMYLNNQINSIKYNYMSPYEKNNGTQIVWFYADIKEWNDPNDLTKEEIDMMRRFGE